MPELVTPNKISQFCSEIFNPFCIEASRSVYMKPYEDRPDIYFIEGGVSKIVIVDSSKKIPVVLLKNNFWIHFSITFKRINRSNGNSHEILGLSLQVFREQKTETVLLFRAEWDNKLGNEFEHPQPHWHFHPHVNYSFQNEEIDADSFNTFLELINESGFKTDLSEIPSKPLTDISDFHFAMSSKWHEKKSAIIPLTEKSLLSWLSLIMRNIDLQIKYCYS